MSTHPLTHEAAWPHWSPGELLRKAREDAKIGVSEMAVKLGVKRNTISNYEHGKTTPQRAVVLLWEQYTNAPEGSLVAAYVRERESGCIAGRGLDWTYVFGSPAQMSLFGGVDVALEDAQRLDATIYSFPDRDRRHRAVPVAHDRRHHEPIDLGQTG